MSDLFECYGNNDLKTKQDIMKKFKMVEKKIEKPFTIKKYENPDYPDYSIVSENDGFHPITHFLYRNGIKIYSQRSPELFVDVILKDIKNPMPYYVLFFDEKNSEEIIVDVSDKRLEIKNNGSKKKIIEKGYYEKTEIIDKDNFTTVFYHIDKDGNPTKKFNEDDYKNLERKIMEKINKETIESEKKYISWKKRNKIT